MSRTKTYIAGDWDHDDKAVKMLHYWNNSSKYGLSFSDAHDLTQARDTSLKCSIKRSLAYRMNESKTFVLIVGEQTKNLRAGSCYYCDSYNNYTCSCARGNSVDYQSYIDFECKKAVSDELEIIVFYNSTVVNRDKCPEIVRWRGVHRAMQKRENGQLEWDYANVKAAFNESR